ncbi:hypothetical protein SteCoe_23911 [Stentor coeruleus]|uniref:Uncharacterized protein n=1 Tax=Stentor coeruleus TaxID=5963 RepID=A0A1R2BIW4_9CILI|nr:hypothetical protein SteCoe_23911 [Stentor coeruleus]
MMSNFNYRLNSSSNLKITTPSRLKKSRPRYFDSPTFTISRGDRFEMTIFEKFKYMSGYFKSLQPKPTKSAIRLNKDMRPFTPKEQKERSRIRFEFQEAKSIEVRKTKSILIKRKKNFKEFKLEEKFKKLFFRQQHPEVLKVFMTWFSLFTLYALPLIIKTSIHKKKIHKTRVAYLLKQFSILALFIGKILNNLQFIKKRRALKKIQTLEYYCLKWVKNKRTQRRKYLSNFFDTFLNSYCMKLVLSTWKSKIIFIQNTMKNAIRYKAKLYEKLLEMWREMENTMINTNISRSNTIRDSVKQVEIFQHFSLISNSKRLSYIKDKIKEIVKVYSLQMRNYNDGMRMMNTEVINSTWYGSTMVNWKRKKPEKPSILEQFNEDVFKDLIKIAMKDRKNMRTAHFH